MLDHPLLWEMDKKSSFWRDNSYRGAPLSVTFPSLFAIAESKES